MMAITEAEAELNSRVAALQVHNAASVQNAYTGKGKGKGKERAQPTQDPDHDIVLVETDATALRHRDGRHFNVRFIGCRIDGLNLDNCLFINVIFNGCSFTDTTFSNVFLMDMTFEGTVFNQYMLQNNRWVKDCKVGGRFNARTRINANVPEEISDPTWVERNLVYSASAAELATADEMLARQLQQQLDAEDGRWSSSVSAEKAEASKPRKATQTAKEVVQPHRKSVEESQQEHDAKSDESDDSYVVKAQPASTMSAKSSQQVITAEDQQGMVVPSHQVVDSIVSVALSRRAGEYSLPGLPSKKQIRNQIRKMEEKAYRAGVTFQHQADPGNTASTIRLRAGLEHFRDVDLRDAEACAKAYRAAWAAVDTQNYLPSGGLSGSGSGSESLADAVTAEGLASHPGESSIGSQTTTPASHIGATSASAADAVVSTASSPSTTLASHPGSTSSSAADEMSPTPTVHTSTPAITTRWPHEPVIEEDLIDFTD